MTHWSATDDPRGRPWPLLALLALTLLAYSPTLDSYFLADDFSLFADPLGGGRRNLLLTHSEYMRPIPRLSMRVDFLLWGRNTVPAHIVNLVLHLASTLMLGILAWRLSASRGAAWATAILFALHPIHVGAVSWLSGRFDLFCSAFLLGSLLKYGDYATSGSRTALGSSLLLFVCALFSKELAISFPLVVALYELVRSRGKSPYRWKALVPYVAAAGLYLAVRFLALGGVNHLRLSTTPLEALERLLVIPIRIMSSPVDRMQWGDWAWVLATVMTVLLIASVAFGLWHRRFRIPVGLWLGLGLIVTASLPMFAVIGAVGGEGIAASRLFYLPSAGFCMVLGELLGGVRARIRWALLAPLALTYCATTFGNNLAWRKAGILSAAIPRQIAALYPTFGVRNPTLIVQDAPRRHCGAYVYLHGSLARALRLTLTEPHRTQVVETIGRWPTDLRRFDRPNKVVALKWDPDSEQVIDVTAEVRLALRSIFAEEASVAEWTADGLSAWTFENADGEVTDGGFRGALGQEPMLLSSPPLTRRTGSLELEVSVTPPEPARGRPRMVVTWWADGQTPGLNRQRLSMRPDGDVHPYRVSTTLRCFEDLRGESLRVRAQLDAPDCRVDVLLIRALPFEVE